MEGRGVVNYNVQHSSFAFSASTTEFDEELIRRKIVTREDAIVAKGASRDQAQALLGNRSAVIPSASTSAAAKASGSSLNPDGDDVDDEEEEWLDDELRERYRTQRLEEIQECTRRIQHVQESARVSFGEVVCIGRPEWTREVNEASERAWVVVCLTSSDVERTGCVEQSCRQLSQRHRCIKFVLIPSHSAIPNWPHHKLPSLFLYRHGTMQHQLVELPTDLQAEQLTAILQELSVLEAH